MKVFFTTLAIALSSIFALNFYVDPFGLRDRSVRSIIGDNPDHCAIDRAFVPEGLQLRFRGDLLRDTGAKVIALGSSRVGKIRTQSLETPSFVNFTLPDMGPNSFPGFGAMLPQYPNLKTVFLGIEYYSFGNQTTMFKVLDKLYSMSKKFGFESAFGKIFFSFYSFRGSPLFQNRIFSIYNFIGEYLSLPATRRSLNLMSQSSLRSKVFKLSLPPYSLSKSKCILSTTPEINRDGAWDALDGSDYNYGDLTGTPTSPDFKEYDPELFNGTDSSSHWHLFVGFTKLSDTKLLVLSNFLEKVRDRGIQVVGFTSPFPDKLAGLWQDRGFQVTEQQFDKRAEDIFGKFGFKYFPQFKSSEIGCRDMVDFDDVWHPGSACIDKFIRVIKSRTILSSDPAGNH